MNQPNLVITPVYDYTGRDSERGGVGGMGIGGMNTPIDPWNNEFTRMREEANTQALYDLMGKVFPVHPALGGQVQELARMIMDTAAGQGTTTAKDREWHTGKSDPSESGSSSPVSLDSKIKTTLGIISFVGTLIKGILLVIPSSLSS